MLRSDKLENDLDRVGNLISESDKKLADIFNRILGGVLEKEIHNSRKKEENLLGGDGKRI